MNSEDIFRLFHLLSLRKMLAEHGSYPTLRRIVEETLTQLEEDVKGAPKLEAVQPEEPKDEDPSVKVADSPPNGRRL